MLQNLMVSSISSILRPRRDRNNGKSKKLVEIEVAPTIKEEYLVESPTSSMSSTVVEEVVLESPPSDDVIISSEAPPTDITRVVVIETNKQVEPCGACCITNSIQKVKDAVDDIPTEYKEAAKYSGFFTASLAVLFVSIVLYRSLSHLIAPHDDGFFCTYFSAPFTPLFDAICAEQSDFITEVSRESSKLTEELSQGFFGFFESIFDGFHACFTIFNVLFSGIWDVICSGAHELWENVSENIAYLVQFCVDFVHVMYRILAAIVLAVLQLLSDSLHSVKNIFFADEPASWW